MDILKVEDKNACRNHLLQMVLFYHKIAISCCTLSSCHSVKFQFSWFSEISKSHFEYSKWAHQIGSNSYGLIGSFYVMRSIHICKSESKKDEIPKLIHTHLQCSKNEYESNKISKLLRFGFFYMMRAIHICKNIFKNNEIPKLMHGGLFHFTRPIHICKNKLKINEIPKQCIEGSFIL